MIVFEKIRWKNLLATGNQFTEVQLNKNSTTLIVGANGAGKSTILDAICFSLYGKAFRKINKAQLINTTNEKGCVVEVEFSINGTNWKVVRGIKPNIFQIYRDDKELDQSASAIDQQKWLEQNVLKMNYKSFTQIVILGSSTFVPFMQLPLQSRREVVEDLLDIKIFSSMNVVLKEKIRTIKDEIKTLKLKKESLKDKVEMQKNFIEEINNLSNENINNNKESIITLQSEVEDLFKDTDDLNQKVSLEQDKMKEFQDASSKIKQYGNIKGKLSEKINTIVREHKFFTDNTVCPTCDQHIEDEFRVNRIEDSQNKAKELQKGFKELELAIKDEELRESTFNKLSQKTSKLLNDISQINSRINFCQKQIQKHESEIQKITTQLESRNTENDKLGELQDNLQETYEILCQKNEDLVYLDTSYELLKDGGVKSLIIKKYLPLINQQVNKYLQMMDFYINFSFNTDFEEEVLSPIHEDFSYSSFSEGEKSRIDLALIFTWREIARFKNSVNTNLLLMDETFDSSLDGGGSEELMKILKYVLKDVNVHVISHKEGLEDRFDEVIRFEKIKGFSHMKTK